ncbi:MAG TPA: adenylate/guanylate cyclase domain-containing protein [Gaiellales bacterium]|nr:adenylate/guanylate cyclase domain-containing protein [Gaiellales bacterium]
MVGREIQYARSGGVAIAYQVVGEGDTDLVYVPDYMSNLVYGWEYPRWRDFYLQLSSRFRLILFDKRGTGLSDHGGQFATLETRMEDLHSVLDAAGSARTVILASHEGCGMAALYAATYPERTAALALFHPRAYGHGLEDPDSIAALADLRDRWGTDALSGEIMREGCPSLFPSEEERRWFANYLRIGAGPAVAYALNRAFEETDLRDVLPAVRVPTVVLHRTSDRANALDVAARIPSSQTMLVSGDDYLEIHLSAEVTDLVAEFVSGQAAPEVPDSVLATVMFTDIVASTKRAASLGDRAWRDLLTRHHAVVRRELGRFRGEERDTAGDGFFATFDGPARAIRCGQAIVAGLEPLGLETRIGIHVGECEVHESKLAGLAVAVGARISAEAGSGEVLVSGTVKDLVAGSGLEFSDRGRRALKGVPGQWPLYAVA